MRIILRRLQDKINTGTKNKQLSYCRETARQQRMANILNRLPDRGCPEDVRPPSSSAKTVLIPERLVGPMRESVPGTADDPPLPSALLNPLC